MSITLQKVIEHIKQLLDQHGLSIRDDCIRDYTESESRSVVITVYKNQ